MAAVAVYPGTFDPFTMGHADLAVRAATIFDRLIIAVAAFPSPSKKPLFTADERLDLAEKTLGHIPNIEIVRFDTLLAHFARDHNAKVVVRGLRAVADYEYETQLAGINRHLVTGLETLFLTCDSKYAYISSSLVKEVAALGGDISEFLHPDVYPILIERLNQRS